MPKFTTTSPSGLRPLSWRDVGDDAPLRSKLEHYQTTRGSGWAARAAFDGVEHQLRAGDFDGPRSKTFSGEPGCYALRLSDGVVFEVFVPSTAIPAAADVEVQLVAVDASELHSLNVPSPENLRDWDLCD